tara:strand:+ start:624 stop:2543 length:1920 start_codon:yes stop_codon:yes gene_type:complete
MATRSVTELDFEGIKNNLKLYLRDQSEFQDYDFEASGMAVLIDLLSYNTHYNAILAHMTANEAFLDSAVKRSSVASIAKTMGYTARSARAARATINVTIVPDSSYAGSNFTLSRDAIFKSSIDGKTLNFYPKEDYVASRSLLDGVEIFALTNVELVEGSRVINSELVEATSVQGPVFMANPDVDTTTVRVRIQSSVTDLTLTNYTFSDNIISVTGTSKVFFIEEALNGAYQVLFGDGNVGNKLTVGNVVRVDYIATNAAAGNGAKIFQAPSGLTGSGSTTTLTLVSQASGGSEQESTDSIRFSAPRFNATKNRAVTANDYQSLILDNNPNVKSVAVWGGERNVPPIYGKVFVSLQAKDGFIITAIDKDRILKDFIEPRQPISLLTEFVDPEFTSIGMNVNVDYDAKTTSSTAGEIATVVDSAITNFFDTTLNTLDTNFYYSKLVADLVKSDKSIIGANIALRMRKTATPALNVSTKYQFDFNNKINPYALNSNNFSIDVNGKVYEVKMVDVPDATVVAPSYNGSGIIALKEITGSTTVVANAGTVNYDTGLVILNGTKITTISGSNNTTLAVSVTPHETSKDIKTQILVSTTVESSAGSAVMPQPSKNIILNLDTTTGDVPNNVFAGVTVTANPKVSDY